MNSLRDGKDERIFNIKLVGAGIFGLLCCIVGIILLSNYVKADGYEIVKDYTDCIDKNRARCMDILKAGEICYCYIAINITEPMKAPVTIFYELESYDQISNNYSKSRDDNQLAGHLSLTPSESCGTYTYVNTTEGRKPIAPCGALADAIFNDTFNLHTNNEYVHSIHTGLISEDDKKPYRNPAGKLEEAFKPFSKPINWVQNVWELDNTTLENNGFQNEAFIAWMKTDWKRKPAWRVNHTGLYEHGVPVAVYTLRVQYAYPPSRYNGPRKFIISSVHVIVNWVKFGFGIALLVIGLLCFVILGVILIWKRRSTRRQ